MTQYSRRVAKEVNKPKKQSRLKCQEQEKSQRYLNSQIPWTCTILDRDINIWTGITRRFCISLARIEADTRKPQ